MMDSRLSPPVHCADMLEGSSKTGAAGGQTITAILERLGIDRMTLIERIALAQEILDSMTAEQPRLSLSEAKLCELERRIADDLANPSDTITWEHVEAAALARFGR